MIDGVSRLVTLCVFVFKLVTVNQPGLEFTFMMKRILTCLVSWVLQEMLQERKIMKQNIFILFCYSTILV